jgi:hypothetical protein
MDAIISIRSKKRAEFHLERRQQNHPLTGATSERQDETNPTDSVAT